MSLNEAIDLQNEGRYEEANQIFVKLMKNSNVPAMIQYAANIYFGNGVEKNRSKSYELFDKVININPNASIIEIYAIFRFEDHDIFLPTVSEVERYELLTRTFSLLEFAVVYGSQNPKIFLYLGNCYEAGYGTIIDNDKAIENYETALHLASNKNEFMKKDLYFLIGRLQIFNKNTLNEAFKNLQNSAERGCKSAFVFVGRIYYEGKIVQKDESAAFKWFTKAAKCGISEGQFYLAEMLEKGIEKVVEKNLDKAIELYFAVALNLNGKNDVIIESLPEIASLPENCGRIDQKAIEKLRTYRPELLNLLEKHKICSSKFDSCTINFTNENPVNQRIFYFFGQPKFTYNFNCICPYCMKNCFSGYRLVDGGVTQYFCDCTCSINK